MSSFVVIVLRMYCVFPNHSTKDSVRAMAFVTCTHCSRHVRDTESSCPFCKTGRVASAHPHSDFSEQPHGLSRSALVLASTLALAGCDSVRQGNTNNEHSIVQPYGAPIPPQPPRPVDNSVAVPAYGAPIPLNQQLPVQVQVMDTGVASTVDANEGLPNTRPPNPQPNWRTQSQTQTQVHPTPPSLASAYGAPAPHHITAPPNDNRNVPRYGAPPPPESPHYKDEA